MLDRTEAILSWRPATLSPIVDKLYFTHAFFFLIGLSCEIVLCCFYAYVHCPNQCCLICMTACERYHACDCCYFPVSVFCLTLLWCFCSCCFLPGFSVYLRFPQYLNGTSKSAESWCWKQMPYRSATGPWSHKVLLDLIL